GHVRCSMMGRAWPVEWCRRPDGRIPTMSSLRTFTIVLLLTGTACGGSGYTADAEQSGSPGAKTPYHGTLGGAATRATPPGGGAARWGGDRLQRRRKARVRRLVPEDALQLRARHVDLFESRDHELPGPRLAGVDGDRSVGHGVGGR